MVFLACLSWDAAPRLPYKEITYSARSHRMEGGLNVLANSPISRHTCEQDHLGPPAQKTLQLKAAAGTSSREPPANRRDHEKL